MPTVGQVVAVVDAQLGSGLLRCLGPGCGGRLARWGFGQERDVVGLGGVTGRVRPRRALCAGCGVSRVLLPDSMLRRRQYGVVVIWAALLAAARQQPWNQVAAGLGVPYTTVREWLRRFARRADRVHAWLCGLLPWLVDDPVWPAGTAGAGGDVLAVLGALHQQMPGRWPLAARLSRCGLLAPSWPPGAGQHEFAGDIAAGGRHLGVPGSSRSSPREVPRVSSAEHERLLRRARAQDVALFRTRRLVRHGPTVRLRQLARYRCGGEREKVVTVAVES